MTETCYTLVVNAHGALLGLVMKVQPGDLLAIKNLVSGEEKHSRVIRVSKEDPKQNQVAIEFAESAPHFWHIAFPPEDWALVQD